MRLQVGGLATDVSTVEFKLLEPQEPDPVCVENREGRSCFFLVCEHAGRYIPDALANLGLGPAELTRHIAYDIGALDVARGVSRALDTALIHQPYSRLVVDCNRPPFAEDSIPPISEATLVPGNAGLPSAALAARRRSIFHPFHERIGTELTARDTAGRPTVLIAIHSFTPALRGEPRPWHVGVQYGRDPRFAGIVLEFLQRDGELCVGDNQPYPVDDRSHYTIPYHGESRGYAHAMIEIRQDLLESEAGRAAWAARLADVLGQARAAWESKSAA